ncbi:MAG: flagellar protein FlgN [Bacteriovoracaceae bacterium]|jgi:flagellar biosynthesis/type III secretory pathway chaperone
MSAMKKLYYQQAIIIWEQFCKLHRELFDLTCDEYLVLLASDIDQLETMLPLKEEIIQRIVQVESERAALIHTLNTKELVDVPLVRVADLLDYFDEIEAQSGVSALKNLNSLLIDIVGQLQEQNKKNQQFLNKAMLSIRDIKESFSGKKKPYKTYGADGMTKSLPR